MKLTPVESSVIKSIGHSPATSTLRVRFKTGRLYDYHNVPGQEYANLLHADSIGSYFNRHIRNHYPYNPLN